MIDYRVISKSAIPPTPPSTNENYGEWLAIARLLDLLAPNEAVEIELAGRNAAVVVSSLHSAARSIGLRVSTMRAGDRMYTFRVGQVEPTHQPKRFTFQCLACKQLRATKWKRQKYCSETQCQRARHNKNSNAWRAA